MAKWKKLALKGGGAKGYVYIGVAQALEEHGILQQIDGVAGSSVGSIGCLLLSCGFSADEIKNIIYETNIENMIYDCWFITEIYNQFEYGGLHRGLELYDWFGSIVESVTGNKDTTFTQWHAIKEAYPEKGLKDMFIEACNINTYFNEVFSYQTKNKDVPIRDAVRASMAFPYLFTPWKIGDDLYEDGGIQCNCPIAVFNENQHIDPKALGIWLTPSDLYLHFNDNKPLPKHPTKWMCQRLTALIESSLNTQLYELENSPYASQLIFCNTLGVGTLDFSLSEQKKEDLIVSGYKAVQHYLERQSSQLDSQMIPPSLTPSFNSLKSTQTETQTLEFKNENAVTFSPYL